MNDDTIQTQEKSSDDRFRVNNMERLMWLAKIIFGHESRITTLKAEKAAMISNYDAMINKEEVRIQEFLHWHGADAREVIKAEATGDDKSVMTPHGRFGYRAKPGSISGDTVPALEFWESDFPNIVEKYEKKKAMVSNLTAEEREKIYRMKVEGTLPSFIKVSLPDPEAVYLNTNITTQQAEDGS